MPATSFSTGKVSVGRSERRAGGGGADGGAEDGAGGGEAASAEASASGRAQARAGRAKNFTLRKTRRLPGSIPSAAPPERNRLSLTVPSPYVTFDPDDLRRVSGGLGRKLRRRTGNPLLLQRGRADRQGRSRDSSLLLFRLVDRHLRQVRPAARRVAPVGKVRRVLPEVAPFLGSQHGRQPAHRDAPLDPVQGGLRRARRAGQSESPGRPGRYREGR